MPKGFWLHSRGPLLPGLTPGGEPFRTIAALELLGTLVSLVVLVPVAEPRGESSVLVSLTCSTDKQGNSFLLDRMLTTRHPLGIVLMELAHQMKQRRIVLRARWLPRQQNQEADDLTNAEYRHSDPRNRIEMNVQDPGSNIMDSLFKEGDAYIAELEQNRASEKRKKEARLAKGREAGARKGRKERSMRETDPW